MPLNKVNYVDGQTLITAQNMNDIQDEVIRLGEKQIVQSDWLEDILLFIEESMITFTVNGVAHRAIKGMTWGEWINSRYNDTELTVVTHWQAGQMIGISSGYILRPHSYVRPNEVIQAEEYSLGREVSEPT